MNGNYHESFEHLIDESLAAGISAEQERSLREHLESCPACKEYLGASRKTIASLAGFSFAVDPALHAKVSASLRLRTQQLQAAQPRRQRWVLISLVAAVLTMSGSFLDLQCGRLLAPFFNLQHTQMQHGLLAFWIVPSLYLLLLFPLLPLLLKTGTRREGRTL